MNRRFIAPRLADGLCAFLEYAVKKIQKYKRLDSVQEELDNSHSSFLSIAYFWIRQLIRFCSVGYIVGLLCLTLCFRFIGQNNITTAALMYLPPWLWIAPALVIIPLTVLFDWKSLVSLMVVAIGYLLFHMDYKPNGFSQTLRSERISKSLRVFTWNRGQSRGVSLQPLKNQLKPDLILLQDAGRRFEVYRNTPEYAEFSDIVSSSEFTLLSRWPVLASESLAFSAPAASGISHPAAARFEVAVDVGRVVVYTVHLHTPRGALESYKHGSFLYGIIGLPGTPWGEKRKIYQSFWDQQMAVSSEIVDRIKKETLPVIVLGDFNTPAFGPIYGRFRRILQDAHQVAGMGFGYSFPGNSKSVFTLRRPWLRLDQIFVSSDWDVLNSSIVEANAQHLPVFADIRLR